MVSVDGKAEGMRWPAWDLDSLVAGPARYRRGLLGGTFAGVLAVSLPWVHGRQQEAEAGLRQQQIRLQEALAVRQAERAGEQAAREETARLQRALDGWLARVPQDSPLPVLVDRLARQAGQCGLVLAGLQPGAVEETPFQVERPVRFRLEGGYVPLLAFLAWLGREGEAGPVTIETLELAPASGSGTRDGRLVLSGELRLRHVPADRRGAGA